MGTSHEKAAFILRVKGESCKIQYKSVNNLSIGGTITIDSGKKHYLKPQSDGLGSTGTASRCTSGDPTKEEGAL